MGARLSGLNSIVEAMGEFGGFEIGNLQRAVCDSDPLAATWGPKEGSPVGNSLLMPRTQWQGQN